MADAMMWAMLAALVAALGMAVYAVFAAGRRARWLKRAGMALVVSLALGGLGGMMLGAQQDEAARQAGVDTKAAYDAMLADQAREAEQAAEEAKCRQDLRCWAERHSFDAGVSCAIAVEDLAKYDYEWANGWGEPKFSHFKWLDKQAGTVTYLGDQIRFQNGLGNFIRHTYTCDYDPTSGAVLRVLAEPGRL